VYVGDDSIETERRLVMGATIDIDFQEGTIEGDFDRSDTVGMINALETLAVELRIRGSGLAYMCYDKGRIYAG
jgi:hypothetical protein